MEDITTRNEIGRNWCKTLIENKTSGKIISRPNKTQERAPLRCPKCGSTSNLANNFSRKARINEVEIEKGEDTKYKNDVSVHESDSEPSEEEELPDQISIENTNVSF
ncbi:hypothetical protein O181_095460 [Austropuccinia psidii MF-1]|uniref:Uncharacterized protein n=1 Tax=Austropuccinia psidii MF-1 TaxID=1389203 RepID=A0A9Q3J5N6_9BASI|nr:hypothetical protein [Austropuccinia psidii MF-1]